MAVTFIKDENGQLVGKDTINTALVAMGQHVGGSSSLFIGPWPGYAYMILDHHTGRALGALWDDKLAVMDAGGILSSHAPVPVPAPGPDTVGADRAVPCNTPARIVWHSVTHGPFFTFRNQENGRLLCDDGRDRMRFIGPMEQAPYPCELFLPRPHPHGGFRLMVPDALRGLRPVVIDRDTGLVVVLRHREPQPGEGVWRFVLVEAFTPVKREQ